MALLGCTGCTAATAAIQCCSRRHMVGNAWCNGPVRVPLNPAWSASFFIQNSIFLLQIPLDSSKTIQIPLNSSQRTGPIPLVFAVAYSSVLFFPVPWVCKMKWQIWWTRTMRYKKLLVEATTSLMTLMRKNWWGVRKPQFHLGNMTSISGFKSSIVFGTSLGNMVICWWPKTLIDHIYS